MPGISAARVVAVIAETEFGRAKVGSGYLLDAAHVLTAFHCLVDDETGWIMARLKVASADGGREVEVTVAESARELDVALLAVTGNPPWGEELPGGPVAFGELDREHAGQVDCVAAGFPRWQAGGGFRDVAEVHGPVYLLEGRESRRAVLRAPALESVTSAGGPAWAGFSGAAVFCGELLVGVVIEHHPRQGGSSLQFRPIGVIADDGDDHVRRLAGALGVNRPGALLPVTAGPVLAQAAPRFREVTSWDAKQLNVHPAVSGQQPEAQTGFVLPEYVPRPHDIHVRECLERLTAESQTRLLLLRGGSCTGKTRAAYEAVKAMLPEWCLAYPKTAEALLALLNGPPVEARSVIWLDDLHHLLNEPTGDGDKAASRLRDLLHAPGPMALVATAWPDALEELTAVPETGHPDRHYHARMLLREAWITEVPDTFANLDAQELERLAVGDATLMAAMQAAGPTGEVTQTLAAAPELMKHWLRAHTPYGKAVITAAVDARRFGIHAPLPHAFLEAAASGYVTPSERARAQPEWFEEALGYGRRSIKRVTSALLPVAPPIGMGALPGVSDLADYLEQHGAEVRWGQVPPADFWIAALDHISGGADLERLGLRAFSCGRFRLSRDLNLLALRKGNASAFEGLCFSYIETDRILTQQGRDELVSVVRDAGDGGYSLWYLGQTLWSIHDEPGGGGEETLISAGELLSDSYDAGYLDAALSLEQVCAALGVDPAGLLDDARQKKAKRAASSLQDFARDMRDRYTTSLDIDESVTPAELLSLLAEQTVQRVDDYKVQASVLHWWRERPGETRDLLDFCSSSNRIGAVIDAARSLLKLPDSAARRMGEEALARLANDGHGEALMALAHRRITQWQQGDPAADEEVPQDILILLERAAENLTEARRLLGQVAARKGDTAEAERLFRSALDGGDYTVIRELASVLHPRSPEGARQLVLSGLDADGSPCPPW